jgi:hypothetical protein
MPAKPIVNSTMRHAACLLAIATSALAALPVHAQPQLQTNEPVFKSGNWYVVRTSKPRSDAVSCTGFYGTRKGIQLTQDSLMVRVSGEIQRVVISFGEKARPERAPQPVEKDMGAVVLTGDEFARMRRSKTLKIEVGTSQGPVTHELKMQGLTAALGNIADGCPVPAQRLGLPAPESAAPSCSSALLTRLRANGVTEKQIAASCG